MPAILGFGKRCIPLINPAEAQPTKDAFKKHLGKKISCPDQNNVNQFRILGGDNIVVPFSTHTASLFLVCMHVYGYSFASLQSVSLIFCIQNNIHIQIWYYRS